MLPNGSAPCNTMTNLFGRQQDIANATLGQGTCENNTDNSFDPTIHQETRVASTLPVQVCGYTVELTYQRKYDTFPVKFTTTTSLPSHHLSGVNQPRVNPVLVSLMEFFVRDYLIELCILFSVYAYTAPSSSLLWHDILGRKETITGFFSCDGQPLTLVQPLTHNRSLLHIQLTNLEF